MKYIKIVSALVVISVIVAVGFFINSKVDLNENSSDMVAKCVSINTGSALLDVKKMMGKPSSERVSEHGLTLAYFTGGIKTEAGIVFEFRNGIMERKDCGKGWESN